MICHMAAEPVGCGRCAPSMPSASRSCSAATRRSAPATRRTGTPVTVTVAAGRAVFDPVVGTCCSTINFFSGLDSANAWIAAHPQLSAPVLDQDAAVALGRAIFGPLLTNP